MVQNATGAGEEMAGSVQAAGKDVNESVKGAGSYVAASIGGRKGRRKILRVIGYRYLLMVVIPFAKRTNLPFQSARSFA